MPGERLTAESVRHCSKCGGPRNAAGFHSSPDSAINYVCCPVTAAGKFWPYKDTPESVLARLLAEEPERRQWIHADGPDLCFVLTEDNGSFCGRTLPCPEHNNADADA
jgi:hypothetical protein